ncbi:MAG: ribulokinase [Fimbriimonadaceae bacterium]
MPQYALGVDYGTNSVRALVVDIATGEELGTGIWPYATGEQGVWLDPKDPHLARQHPLDYANGFYEAVSMALEASGVNPADIIGIGVDTTGSTPIPVNAQGIPLALLPEWQGNLNAMAWLWKDHTGHAEAAEITALAKERREPYLDKCGGAYSSEWFWAKILRCKRVDPAVFEAAYSWVEAQDMIPAWLCGLPDADSIPRGICAAGHKAMFHEDWGGLPSVEFLEELEPGLGTLRARLYAKTQSAGDLAGRLDAEIAARCGLRAGTPVSIGAFDAHLGAIGSGVKPGTLVKIMGTSTCDIMVGEPPEALILGVCGVVPGSVIPGMIGIEAGQSAVGDLFNWWVNLVAPDEAISPHLAPPGERRSGGAGSSRHEHLATEAAKLRAGQSGLIALDWNNGNRTILVDPLLSGLIVGQTLHTSPAEIYRALIEATAFGALTIIRRIEESGVPIQEVVVCGGIAEKSSLTMQIYADVLNRPIKISASAQTCALGAAIAGAVASGGHPDILTAQSAMVTTPIRTFVPSPEAVKTYEQLYKIYSQLHDAFGIGDMASVMKNLVRLRTA